jgi:hypothetical protein
MNSFLLTNALELGQEQLAIFVGYTIVLCTKKNYALVTKSLRSVNSII